MTWKRVATAAVLIPFVVALVWKAPTALLSVALSLVVLLAMFEFFALGDAIGHRAYRYWTAVCGILLVYVQYLTAMDEQHSVGNGPVLHKIFGLFKLPTPTVADVFFIFLIGIAILTLATRRPLVEALPAESATTPKRGASASTTERHWRPIEPVEPRMASCFTKRKILFSSGL